MKKTAARSDDSILQHDQIDDEMRRFMNVEVAKSQFMTATANMSWRLAFTVVVPIVAGVKLDEHFKSSPSLTLLGIMIAAVAGCAAVWSVVKDLNKEQAKEDAKMKTKRRTRGA